MRVAIVIPVRLASTRLPKKALLKFGKLTMIEHVWQRALLVNPNDDVYVATCDPEIQEIIGKRGGKVIMTSRAHGDGSSRVAEAASQIDCSHIISLQGDEPLIHPENLKRLKEVMENSTSIQYCNLVASVTDQDMNSKSVVKAIVNDISDILYCFRVSPFLDTASISCVRKMLGVMGFSRSAILEYPTRSAQFQIAAQEKIEQLSLIFSQKKIKAIDVKSAYDSINLPTDYEKAKEIMKSDKKQLKIQAMY